jgi:hypothetical protein
MGCTQPALVTDILMRNKTQEKLCEAIEEIRKNAPQFFGEA